MEEKNVNRYTGEVLPFKTVSSVVPSKGIKNEKKDLCRKEDFEPISVMVKRFFRGGFTQDESEFDYKEGSLPSLDERNSNIEYDGDALDAQMDLEDYLNGRYASGASVSAVEAEKGASDERPQVSEEQAPSEAEEKPSE